MSAISKLLESLVPTWAWALLFVVALGASFAGAYRYNSLKADFASAKEQWASEREAQAMAALEAERRARSREARLQSSIDAITEEKNREINTLNRRHAAVVDSMRKRANRPAGGDAVPTPARPGDAQRSCTGRELYRQDGEFLVGEAATAERVRLQLVACQEAYRRAKELTDR